jgi:hypothetical protein
MIEDQRFKTMRHIETVRNYLNACIKEILNRSEHHDQSKFESPEREAFDIYTPLLRDLTYGSEEYKACLRNMKPAIEHHHQHNRHHPEYHADGIAGMDLIDLIEMLCDWKAAGLRHDTGDILKSIEINKIRFGFSDELEKILKNTVKNVFDEYIVFHKAEES